MNIELSNKIFDEATSDIMRTKSEQELENCRIKYLGKKGIVTELLKSLGTLPFEQRKESGKYINQLKEKVTKLLDEKKSVLAQQEKEKQYQEQAVDITLPGVPMMQGGVHPLTQTLQEITQIFLGLGFSVETGPEVELDKFNFEDLNFPNNHPARDMHDTFYITDSLLLRTHTSPVQIRAMQKNKPPLKFIAPGKVFRCDSDLTHSPIFNQVEGFWVDDSVSFADLKGILSIFLKKLFNKEFSLRFRPSFFPFTEPSAEVDIQCVMCSGKGCSVCKNSGWLEILGCGMIHPNVLKSAGYESGKYQGFAFGLGVERIAMLKHSINNIRLFYENDIRFLKQF